MCRELAAEVAALRGEMVETRSRIAVLEQRERERRGPDTRLIVALAEAVGSRWFASSDVVTLATNHPGLAAALEERLVEGADEIGAWLRDVRDLPLEGLVVRRGDRRSGRGFRWRVHVCT